MTAVNSIVHQLQNAWREPPPVAIPPTQPKRCAQHIDPDKYKLNGVPGTLEKTRRSRADVNFDGKLWDVSIADLIPAIECKTA